MLKSWTKPIVRKTFTVCRIFPFNPSAINAKTIKDYNTHNIYNPVINNVDNIIRLADKDMQAAAEDRDQLTPDPQPCAECNIITPCKT